MSNHARVITVVGEWHPPWHPPHIPPLHIEYPDGGRSCLPIGLTAKPGDVLAVLSQAEFRLIETYRENMKGKDT